MKPLKKAEPQQQDGGISSGEANETEDFRVTFTGDQDFTYVCEPHATSDMVGIVTVGEGDPAPVSDVDPAPPLRTLPALLRPWPWWPSWPQR